MIAFIAFATIVGVVRLFSTRPLEAAVPFLLAFSSAGLLFEGRRQRASRSPSKPKSGGSDR